MNLLVDSTSNSPSLRPPGSLSEMVDRWMHVPIVLMMGYVGVFSVAFGNLVDVEADNDTVSMGGQAFLKIMMLGVGGIYGGIGFLTDARVRKLIFSFPMMWLVILAGLLFVAVPGSKIPLESMASSISVVCVLLMTATALVQVGVRSLLNTLFAAVGMYVILSWVAFLAVPSIGVFQEPTVDGQTVARMGGLAHPNTLGQVSGLTLVMGLLLYKLDTRLSWLRMIVLVLAAGSLIFSLSRTSLLATIVAVAVVYRHHVFRRRNLFYVVVLGVVGLVGLLTAAVVFDLESAIQSRIGMVSKSGDTDELFSATGRTDIWAYALQLISERPLTGYGAATTKIHLAEYSLHAHNLVINIAFSTGVIGGLVALWMCLERVFGLFVRHHPIADALVAFILVNGLFENVIFSILAGLPTMVWTAGLCVPQLEDDEANQVVRAKEEAFLKQNSLGVRPRKWRLQR